MKKLLMILPLTLILCFMVGCQDKEAMAELEAMKAQAEVEEQNKEIVRRYFDLMDDGNPAYMELSSEDYVVHFPGGFDVKGIENLKKVQEAYFAAFPDLTYFFSDFVSEGDKVAIRYGNTGTHQGVFDGIPPTEKEIRGTAIGIFRLKDGKLVECWIESDSVSFYQQLGMELKPKEK
ncbi:MAG: ester cyclase [Candidatus Aminicenantaceae bacterium]